MVGRAARMSWQGVSTSIPSAVKKKMRNWVTVPVVGGRYCFSSWALVLAALKLWIDCNGTELVGYSF
jgi:hypothetical protein